MERGGALGDRRLGASSSGGWGWGRKEGREGFQGLREKRRERGRRGENQRGSLTWEQSPSLETRGWGPTLGSGCLALGVEPFRASASFWLRGEDDTRGPAQHH